MPECRGCQRGIPYIGSKPRIAVRGSLKVFGLRGRLSSQMHTTHRQSGVQVFDDPRRPTSKGRHTWMYSAVSAVTAS